MSQQWKAWERRVARDLGGVRTGPRGLGLPDVLDLPDGLAPECKYGKPTWFLSEASRWLSATLRSAIKQAQTNAPAKPRAKQARPGATRQGDQAKVPWAVLLMEKGTSTRYAILPYEYFVDLYRKANK